MKRHKLCYAVFSVFVFVFASGCSVQVPSVEERAYQQENKAGYEEQEENTILLTLFPERQTEQGSRLTQAAELRNKMADEREKAEQERAAREKAEKEKAEREKEKQEKEEREKEEREKEEREKAAREKEEKEQMQAERDGVTKGPLGVLMGTFTTSFEGSSKGRIHNIQNAAKKINGTKLSAGESFSVTDAIGPITEENGYRVAGAYQDGKVIDSVGGGVCQISTTLYNACISAELKILERCEHSMTVSYVEVGRDAAIAGDYKNLSFENNNDYPIYIESRATDSEVTFQIWGADTKKKDGRTIEFETVILFKTEPGEPIITEDDSQPEDYYHETQSAHTGYKAEVYKVVYQDGKEKERIKINTSSYEASPAYAVVGTKKS